MKTKSLPADRDRLLALAEAIATVLSEESNEPGVGSDVEALLRASIAATTYGIDRYLALLSGARKSAEAAAFVAEAKWRCDRSIQQLRRPIRRSMAELRRHKGGKVIQRRRTVYRVDEHLRFLRFGEKAVALLESLFSRIAAMAAVRVRPQFFHAAVNR